MKNIFYIMFLWLINISCFADAAYPKELKINENELKEWIDANFSENNINPFFIYELRNLSSEGRKSFIKEFSAWLKFYIESKEFREKFNKKAFEAKPDPEMITPFVSAGDRIKEIENQIEEIKEQLGDKSIGQFARDGLEMSLAQNKENLESLRRDTQTYEADEKKRYDEEKKLFDENQKRFEELKDYHSFLKNKLKNALIFIESIDFSAQLVTSNNLKYFKNNEYQEKSPEWKACFRAGKDIAEELKNIISDWLNELENKKAE